MDKRASWDCVQHVKLVLQQFGQAIAPAFGHVLVFTGQGNDLKELVE
jgi:hypothetical protein